MKSQNQERNLDMVVSPTKGTSSGPKHGCWAWNEINTGLILRSSCVWAQKITQQREAKLNSPEVRMYTSDISAFVFMVVVLHSSTRLMHLMPSGLDWHCWAPAHSFSPCASDFDFLDLDIYIKLFHAISTSYPPFADIFSGPIIGLIQLKE